MKKLIYLLLASIMGMLLLTSCAKATDEIIAISREDGSGTRGAFVELFGIEEKNHDGTRKDKTKKESEVTNKTDVMLTSVEGDKNAIGYVSLSSINDNVKVLQIDSVAPTAQSIRDGSYKIRRPFLIATKNEVDGVVKDFIDYILSAEGQAIISNTCIPIDDNPSAYSGTKPRGRVVIAGSSSVNPVMEKLQEAYLVVNPDAVIEIQVTDSTSGMNAVINEICDIGMSSRDLKDAEKQELNATLIALDGIAIIVNSENSVSDMSSDTVKQIYVGEILNWSDIK